MEKSLDVSNQCSMCSKHMTVTKNSNVCDSCVKSYAKPAFLFCDKCQEKWSVIDPGPVKYGNEVKPGETYHTHTCSRCDPKESYSIIEFERFHNALN